MQLMHYIVDKAAFVGCCSHKQMALAGEPAGPLGQVTGEYCNGCLRAQDQDKDFWSWPLFCPSLISSEAQRFSWIDFVGFFRMLLVQFKWTSISL